MILLNDGILNGILDGILNEIASVALLPRNDGDFRIPCDEILGSSRRMTQNTQGGQFLQRLLRSLCSPLNDGILD